MRPIDLHRLTASALLLALPVLAGCATVGPDYKEPNLPVPSVWSGASSSATSEDLSRWWERLGDPVLTDLVEGALAASPDLRSAQAVVREARARRNIAGSYLGPTVTAGASGSTSESSGSGGSREAYSAGFDASWEVDVFGGTRRAVEAAAADLAASEAGLANTQVTLAAEVALNYVELRALQARLAIARDNLEAQSETLQLTEWRSQAGLVGSLDVEQARANREQTRAQIPSLEAGLAEVKNRLAILLGQAPGALRDELAVAVEIPAVPEQVAVGIPADTLRQRPDVRAAERRLAAATARVGEATADLYPRFTLSGSIGLEALTLSALTGGSAGISSLLGGITAPLFQGGRIRQQIEVQDALQEQALVAYEATVLAALEDVENALVSLSKSRERLAALDSAAEAAQNAALLARQQYSSGLIDFQTVLDTERSVLALEDSRVSIRAEGTSALIQLYKALGGGWSPAGADTDRNAS